jgi:uncharacterized protein YjbI with pentapeptide repeats
MKRQLLAVLILALAGVALWRSVLPMLSSTELDKVDLAGLDLREKSFAGKTLTEVDFRATDLRGVSFRGTALWEVDLRGAQLDGADFTGAFYDTATRWPAGFDPRKHGAQLDDD